MNFPALLRMIATAGFKLLGCFAGVISVRWAGVCAAVMQFHYSEFDCIVAFQEEGVDCITLPYQGHTCQT